MLFAMPAVLALDIGSRRTGVARATTEDGVPLSLTTLTHKSPQELKKHVDALLERHGTSVVVVGLPLLPSGKEGQQARVTRRTVEQLQFPADIEVLFLDERYSTPLEPSADPDSEAAVHLLTVYLDQRTFDK